MGNTLFFWEEEKRVFLFTMEREMIGGVCV